jgi:formylglycine-generating enzyme required for sulfatase activity
MNRVIKLFRATFFPMILIFFVNLCAGQTTQFQDEMDKLQELRAKSLENAQKPLDDLKQKYKIALEKYKENAKNSGNLDALVLVQKELDRWEASGIVADYSTDPQIANLQKILKEQQKLVIEKVDQQIVVINQAYAKQLEDLVKKATQADYIDEAIKIRKVREDFINSNNLGDTQSLRAGQEKQVEIAPGVMMTFCWCPPGEFVMGSPVSEMNRGSNESQVNVRLTKGFWMAKTEVTQKQWQSIVGSNPSSNIGENLPVDSVSWNDIQIFLEKLNLRLENQKEWEIVLPTEAQWEYACRAGETGPYSGANVDEVAWHNGNSGGKTHDVGTKKANSWGLHDVHGNVREWCHDWYDVVLRGGVDPLGANSGSYRVNRGGSWSNHTIYCRAATRNDRRNPSFTDNSFGFRVASNKIMPTSKKTNSQFASDQSSQKQKIVVIDRYRGRSSYSVSVENAFKKIGWQVRFIDEPVSEKSLNGAMVYFVDQGTIGRSIYNESELSIIRNFYASGQGSLMVIGVDWDWEINGKQTKESLPANQIGKLLGFSLDKEWSPSINSGSQIKYMDFLSLCNGATIRYTGGNMNLISPKLPMRGKYKPLAETEDGKATLAMIEYDSSACFIAGSAQFFISSGYFPLFERVVKYIEVKMSKN